MDISEIEREKQAIIEKYGDWTAHSIQLAPNLYTIIGKEPSSGRPAHYVKVLQDFLRRPLHSLRVLDLGCLEGMYALEFARHGAQVLGIEGRLANIEKARFANRVLGFSNCDFVQDDVRNLSLLKYGSFDMILCCGILYHLDAPDVFNFLKTIAEMCRGLTIIDTQVAVEGTPNNFADRLSSPTIYCDSGKEYSGRYYTEFTTQTTEQKLTSLWASLDNNRSFWLDRKSLYRALMAMRFDRIYQDLLPHLAAKGDDRLTYVALKS